MVNHRILLTPAALHIIFLLNLFLEVDSSCDTEVVEFHGFLQLRCKNSPGVFKCANSNETYWPKLKSLGRKKEATVNGTCSYDPFFYQACGMKGFSSATNNLEQFDPQHKKRFCGFLCEPAANLHYGTYFMAPKDICYIPSSKTYGPFLDNQERGSWLNFCDGKNDCLNTDMDERRCSVETYMTKTGRKLAISQICDGECENTMFKDNDCEDEAMCNGYLYGVYCRSDTGSLSYISPLKMECEVWCDPRDANTTILCNENTETCLRGSLYVPLMNSTRCFPVTMGTSLCDDGLDQTNCTDPSRTVLTCEIDGHMSSVSRYAICVKHSGVLPTLCDNGLDKQCVSMGVSCLLHKHQLCDGIRDCLDGADELASLCFEMSGVACYRYFRLNHTSPQFVSFPLGWINDGIEDCTNGVDEDMNWPTCGSGLTRRYRKPNEPCDEVYLCDSGRSFVELSNLCDRIETCGNEIKVCQSSRNMVVIPRKAISVAGSIVKPMRVIFPTCLVGLEKMQNFENMSCTMVPFQPKNYDFYGKTVSTEVLIPTERLNCDNVYGEAYIYLSCTGQCINSSCPLTNHILYSSCTNQYPNRVYSIRNNSDFTFAIKSRDSLYHNDIFVCDNNHCVLFEQVCDLVDNCGDGSDERQCTNNFKCKSGDFIPHSRLCDGNIDCPGMSDECNDRCGRQIIDKTYLKFAALVIGGLAIILNVAALIKSMFVDVWSKKVNLVQNKILVILVGVGDLLTGSYLVGLSGLDLYHGEKFCRVQMAWLTSTTCILIGVGSTIGSHISLSSLTVLSVARCLRIRKSLVAARDVDRKFKVEILCICLLLIAISTAIAVLPVLPQVEDFFVNGLVYEEENRLFLGSNNKAAHMGIFQEYFGRMRARALKWSVITELVDTMFSRDYGGMKWNRLSFYGNDPVCLFKYFVTLDDPQRTFVWSVLSLNFLCIIVISACYLMINLSTSKVSQLTADKRTKKMFLKRSRRTQRKTAMIVMTDFLCWCPFLFVCLLHSAEKLNAVPMYPYFSILVLPINSAINPVLYTDVMVLLFKSAANKIQCARRTMTMSLSLTVRKEKSNLEATPASSIEMHVMNRVNLQVDDDDSIMSFNISIIFYETPNF